MSYETAADFIAAQRDECYGTDLFPNLPPEFDWELLDRWLSDTFGFRIDRLSGEYYRRVHDMIERRLRDAATSEPTP